MPKKKTKKPVPLKESFKMTYEEYRELKLQRMSDVYIIRTHEFPHTGFYKMGYAERWKRDKALVVNKRSPWFAKQVRETIEKTDVIRQELIVEFGNIENVPEANKKLKKLRDLNQSLGSENF